MRGMLFAHYTHAHKKNGHITNQRSPTDKPTPHTHGRPGPPRGGRRGTVAGHAARGGRAPCRGQRAPGGVQRPPHAGRGAPTPAAVRAVAVVRPGAQPPVRAAHRGRGGLPRAVRGERPRLPPLALPRPARTPVPRSRAGVRHAPPGGRRDRHLPTGGGGGRGGGGPLPRRLHGERRPRRLRPPAREEGWGGSPPPALPHFG